MSSFLVYFMVIIVDFLSVPIGISSLLASLICSGIYEDFPCGSDGKESTCNAGIYEAKRKRKELITSGPKILSQFSSFSPPSMVYLWLFYIMSRSVGLT